MVSPNSGSGSGQHHEATCGADYLPLPIVDFDWGAEKEAPQSGDPTVDVIYNR